MASRPLELVLARAEPDSAPALTCLTQAAKASWGYRPEFLAAWREELTVDAEFFRAHIAWTITLNGELAGWGAWVAWGRRCRLEHLWIAPAYQRQGLGRVLLRHLAQEARATGWRELEIVSDPFAAPFYRACGAQAAGEFETGPGRILPVFVLAL